MSLDVGAIVDSVAPLVASALDTSGVIVDVLRDADTVDTTVDPTTLAVTDPTPPVPVLSDMPALIVPGAREGVRFDGPDRVREVPTYTVSLAAADAVDVRIRDVVKPSASPDPLMVDARLKVIAVGLDATGLLRHLLCEHWTGGGG